MELGHKVFESMQQKGIAPSNVTYSILIKLYSKARTPQKAYGLLEDMRRVGIQPGLVVYTCLIKTSLQHNDIRTTLRLYEQMEKDNVRPDGVTYSTLILGCLHANQLDQAATIALTSLHQSPLLQPPHSVYDQLVTALLDRGDADGARLSRSICDLLPATGTPSSSDFMKRVAKWEKPETAFKQITKAEKIEKEEEKRVQRRHTKRENKEGNLGNNNENVDVHNIEKKPPSKSKFSAFIEKSDIEKPEPKSSFTAVSKNPNPPPTFVAKPIHFDANPCTFRNSKKNEAVSKATPTTATKIPRLC